MILMPLTCFQGISGVASMTSSGNLVAMSPSRPITASPARRNGRSASHRFSRASRVQLLHRLPQSDLPEGHQVLWSQVHSLVADAVVPRLERTPCDDINTNAEKILKILEQPDMIKKGGAGFEVHKQIDIAAWTGVAPSDRAKHGDSMSPSLPRNAEDLGTAAAQPFKGQHIIASGKAPCRAR
jgi:hypothetical protein